MSELLTGNIGEPNFPGFSYNQFPQMISRRDAGVFLNVNTLSALFLRVALIKGWLEGQA